VIEMNENLEKDSELKRLIFERYKLMRSLEHNQKNTLLTSLNPNLELELQINRRVSI